MRTESKSMKEALDPILSVLKDLGGKFSFMDDEGTRFVLATEDALAAEWAEVEIDVEQQLALPQADMVSQAIRKHMETPIEDDVLERINRDIALAYASEQESGESDEIDDLAAEPDYPKPPRIRFEPLKGDLHPDLQD